MSDVLLEEPVKLTHGHLNKYQNKMLKIYLNQTVVLLQN